MIGLGCDLVLHCIVGVSKSRSDALLKGRIRLEE